MRRFLVLLSPLHSSHVSVTEVCPAAQPHVRRILSLFINCLPTHTPPPPICRGSYITARGFLGYGRFTTISLPSLFYPFCKTHIFSSLDIYLKHTFGVKHTKSHNKGCCLIRCVPEPSCLKTLPIRKLAEVNMLAHSDRPCLLPVASVEKRTSAVHSP